MPINFVNGDLFLLPTRVLAHGCNCAGGMGKGIALEFKRRWPRMYHAYKQACLAGEFGPGDVFEWTDGEHFIFNLGTQRHWTTGAEMEAIEKSVMSMLRRAEAAGHHAVALPRIGAGLGRLDWPDVRALLTRLSLDTPVTLIVVEDYVAGQAPGLLP